MKRLILSCAAAALAMTGLAHAANYNKKDTATLRALDKITGRSTDIIINVGEPIVFGSLNVDLKVCYQTPPDEVPESAAFLVVHAVKTAEAVENATADLEADEQAELFSGWMFASSPGLSALEHPVYDIWVIECSTPTPVEIVDPMVEGDTGPVDNGPGGDD